VTLAGITGKIVADLVSGRTPNVEVTSVRADASSDCAKGRPAAHT
jgi:glycine/D-amino acid oxidase-like deaminating enzyme